jgi:hypothetical protein
VLRQLQSPDDIPRSGDVLGESRECVLDQRPWIQDDRVQVEGVDLGPRQVEQVVDDAELMLGAVLDVFQVLCQARRRREEETVGVADDDIERGAQFVADIGQQPRLHLVGALGNQASILSLTEEQGSFQCAADVTSEHLVGGTVARADLEDDEAERFRAKVERLDHQAVPLRGP